MPPKAEREFCAEALHDPLAPDARSSGDGEARVTELAGEAGAISLLDYVAAPPSLEPSEGLDEHAGLKARGQLDSPESKQPAEAAEAAQRALALAVPALRTAKLVRLEGGHGAVSFRGDPRVFDAELDAAVEPALLKRALEERQYVLVETLADQKPVVVGVLQTTLPSKLVLSAQQVDIQASERLSLRSGRAALRFRADGDIEIVGSRISAASRGLFKLVGRILRLN